MQQVRSVMARSIEDVRPDSTIREAAEKMRTSNVGALPVCDRDRVIGMITDRDIVVRAIAQGRHPQQTRVGDVMTREVLYCHEDASIQDAVEQMREEEVGRLIVLSRDNRIRGILSLGDIVKSLGEERLAGLVSERISSIHGRTSRRTRELAETMPVRLEGRNMAWGLGAIASVATLWAGTRLLRRQPEIVNRIQDRIRTRREAA